MKFIRHADKFKKKKKNMPFSSLPQNHVAHGMRMCYASTCFPGQVTMTTREMKITLFFAFKLHVVKFKNRLYLTQGLNVASIYRSMVQLSRLLVPVTAQSIVKSPNPD